MNHLRKSYFLGNKEVEVLRGIDLTIENGSLVSIVGKSGSGKSTLLNIIGMLDDYQIGQYYFKSHLIQGLDETQLAIYRNKFIGFVFQSFNLINTKTALENVALPLYYRNIPSKERSQAAEAMLEKVGLGDRMHHLPKELSGGQKQRVAIARALVTQADLLLADEPTGALDVKTSREILELMMQINQEGKTVIIVTHDQEIAQLCTQKIDIVDGKILDYA
jgi:putative ABC transport system ATP-binding protein